MQWRVGDRPAIAMCYVRDTGRGAQISFERYEDWGWRERVELGKNQVSSPAIIIHNHISWVPVNRPARKVSMPSRYEVVWTIVHPITMAAMFIWRIEQVITRGTNTGTSDNIAWAKPCMPEHYTRKCCFKSVTECQKQTIPDGTWKTYQIRFCRPYKEKAKGWRKCSTLTNGTFLQGEIFQ